jgi:hypothetical protein
MPTYGFKPRRRERREDGSRPRSLGCVWPLFWLILLIVLLGLIFGGYRKGTKVGSQPQFVGSSIVSSGSAHGSAALHSRVY